MHAQLFGKESGFKDPANSDNINCCLDWDKRVHRNHVISKTTILYVVLGPNSKPMKGPVPDPHSDYYAPNVRQNVSDSLRNNFIHPNSGIRKFSSTF